MKRLFAILFLCVVAGIFEGCEIDSGENFHFVSLEITDAEVPENFFLNETHTIEVTFNRPDSCTFFQGFDVFSQDGGIRNIVAIGSVLTDNDCEQIDESVKATFNITILLDEPYTLRFYRGDDADGNPQYLVYEIPVVDNN